jgi:tRNA A-37 threonylcarbamoyl transferase component Bud32
MDLPREISRALAGTQDLDGFRRLTSPGHYMLVAERFERSVSDLRLLEPGGLQRVLANPTGPRGRCSTAVVALPGSHLSLHLRPFRHGGWLGGLRGHGLASLERPVAELRTTLALAAAGAPVPAPALVAAHRVGRWWSVTLGTLFEEGAIDAAAWLASNPSRRRVLRAAAVAGSAIRRFHDAGGCHRDLHIGNLLVRENGEETEVIVVDLDRASLASSVRPARRMRELMRLYRSLVKWHWTEAIGARGYSRFLASYTRGDRRLRDQLLSHLPRERLRASLHVAGYRVLGRPVTRYLDSPESRR